MNLTIEIEDLDPGVSEIGLTGQSIQTAAESRLRSARLYDSDYGRLLENGAYFYINVSLLGPAFFVQLKYHKMVTDSASHTTTFAPTWTRLTLGTHGGNTDSIRSVVSEGMDKFLVEFLRVNEKACEKRFALPNPRNDE